MPKLENSIAETFVRELNNNRFKLRGNKLLDRKQRVIVDNSKSLSISSKISNSYTQSTNIFL
jgi:hypothetical protein